MDFDEYDYLERTVENPDPSKLVDTTNGGDTGLKYGDKDKERRTKHRSDEKDLGNAEDHRSKRSRSGDESRDRNHDSSRDGKSRHRSRSRDGHRDRERGIKDRDREERIGKDRYKERERERDRERDHHRERRDGETERERERERRSSSRSERHRSEREDKERGKSKEREKEVRERERDGRKKKDDATEPEADPERDQRTVFAYQISLKADERDVYEFFSRAGKVRDVRLIMDRNSRRSKGVGYIEFYDVMSVPMAIALSGQPLLGQPVMVKPSEAEKNLVQSTTAAGGSGAAGPYSGGARRLYVGNLHVNITEDQLRQVFEAFGLVELVQLPLDETGHCKGFGFVQFSRLEDARNALSLNGQLELAGRTIKVSTVTDHSGVQETAVNPTDLDDDDGGGLSLNASTRALLIQRLARSDSVTGVGSPSVPAGGGVIMPSAPAVGSQPIIAAGQVNPTLPAFPALSTPAVDMIGVPSECLLLKNMFDPKLETEPDFDLDIKEDVQEECSKFGSLRHIYVDKNSAGFVYLRFDETQSAVSAQRSLHGRWFAGKMITASFMMPVAYETKFSES